MNRLVHLALKISRYRFWIYTVGPFVIGYALGMKNWTELLRTDYLLYLLYFLVPANILIYGINDYWDSDTDSRNPKKNQKEHRINVFEQINLHRLLYAAIIISLLAIIFAGGTTGYILLAIFLFLAYFYSAEPLRFKTIPGIDFLSNILYIIPGIFGYWLATSILPPVILVVAGAFHAFAMHIFSAIPDLEYDREAGILTTAFVLGKKKSIIICFAFWSMFSTIVIILSNFHLASFLSLIYPAIALVLLVKDRIQIENVYWYLPFFNTTLGGILWLFIVFNRF